MWFRLFSHQQKIRPPLTISLVDLAWHSGYHSKLRAEELNFSHSKNHQDYYRQIHCCK